MSLQVEKLEGNMAKLTIEVAEDVLRISLVCLGSVSRRFPARCLSRCVAGRFFMRMPQIL